MNGPTEIGYYVHHRGSGHLNRAVVVAAALDASVTILSSLPRPMSWLGGWVELPLDTDVEPVDAPAGGNLHWAPLDSPGLRSRMAAISEWILANRPAVVVVDVSVEVVAIVRLHGVRVVTYAQPGERLDAAHSLGYRLCSAVIAPWPGGLNPTWVDERVESTFEPIGAISRIPLGREVARRPKLAVVLNGAGGRGASALDTVVSESISADPSLDWVRIEGRSVGEVEHILREASLVFSHAGQNAIAEIAACRTPAVVVAEDRPHSEQQFLARMLSGSGLPAVVSRPGDGADRAAVIAEVTSLDGQSWARWVDGRAAERAAVIIHRVATESSVRSEWSAA